MSALTSLIRELRSRTGAPLMLLREALQHCDNNLDRAEAFVISHRRDPRHGEATTGVIVTGTHQGRIGAMIEVRCGTDFVARTEEFQRLCRELILQVLGGTGVEPLSAQSDIRDPSRTVADLIAETSRMVGEQIVVTRSVRWEV